MWNNIECLMTSLLLLAPHGPGLLAMGQRWGSCKGDFQCLDGRACVAMRFRCDETIDCADGSDEDEAMCKAKPCDVFLADCPEMRRKRKFPACIYQIYVCDGKADCMFGEDELNCTRTCDANFQFPCSDGTCIYLNSECDGTSDCNGGEDEANCDVSYSGTTAVLIYIVLSVAVVFGCYVLKMCTSAKTDDSHYQLPKSKRSGVVQIEDKQELLEDQLNVYQELVEDQIQDKQELVEDQIKV